MIRSQLFILFPFLLSPFGLATASDPSFPLVPEDLEVSLYARDPLVRNPCALTFDAKGRLCVGMGPQYRKPKPDTPGDSVWILLDEDRDGVADGRKEFATGFNAIQGLAWRGDQLWIANAPDLTVVRDLDGDDVADEYVRLYTDLGNLEHGLHGLNWGPDGLLYMSKGNSKGLNQPPHRVAPQPFRELWGQSAPAGTPVFPKPVVFNRDNYEKHYHHPSDDWGLCGGILRCRPDGSNLEIVSLGYRNPWDISYDDGFDWLGTDNDQNHGDKIFSPFYGAHYGWGHPWSYDWVDNQHLPSAPAAGPFFEGSGTGVIFLGLDHYPEKYRGVFLVNDWLKRQIYVFRPEWKGAWMQSATDSLEIFADAGRGRSMDRSDGRAFDPVDIEVGPDGAVYVSSWGRQYGLHLEDGQMANEGRIYRFWPKEAPPRSPSAKRDPWKDLGSHLPIWRSNAQEIIVAEGADAIPRLKTMLENNSLPKRLETWTLWTLGRIDPQSKSIDDYLASQLRGTSSLNRRVQAVRVLAHRARTRTTPGLPKAVREVLQDAEARVRHEAVLALWQAGEADALPSLVSLAAREEDRIVFYSTWKALSSLMPVPQLKSLLSDERGSVRLAATLALLETDALTESEIEQLTADPDEKVARWAKRRSQGKAEGIVKGPALSAAVNAAASTPPLSVVESISSPGGDYRQATLSKGAKAYLDRNYRFGDIPEDLEGETFIQVANNAAEATEKAGFTLTVSTPVTIFLADDVRGSALPAWARARYEPTSYQFHNGDSTMKVFRAEFPAGEIVFGPNSQGVTGNKCHYHVIVRPHLLQPQPEGPPSVEAVISAMKDANPERGRTLFLSKHGATCALCHRLEGRGNLLAPDLSEIGARAEPEFIIRSILEPSAQITEGFAMQVVTTQDGQSVGGIVLEETGRALTFGLPDGSTVSVAKKEIAQRETAQISAMPALAPLLSAQQIADMTVYLMSQGRTEESNNASVAGKTWGDSKQGFLVRGHDDRLDIQLEGQDIVTYYFRHPETRRPFFAHVKTPSGLQVTRNFPPIAGQDPTDHAFMHPGLSLGFAVLDGENFWHNDRGEVELEDFIELPQGGASASFAVRNRYLSRDGTPICREDARYTFTRNDDGYLITFDSAFSSDRPFAFGVKEEMGLALRVASPLRVKNGEGSIFSDHGGRDEKGTWGIQGQWWDYAGPLKNRHVGIQLLSAPGNPPVWAHSRDYGVLVANPFPLDRKENRDKLTPVVPGQSFRLRFGIQVHDHASREAFDAEASHTRYRASLTP